ncbi:MAG: FAD-dependent oxidoreductase [Chloroflexi bacterium]|nr:FAD-dependent oxidoreductase [Chloroflexota bacterium]
MRPTISFPKSRNGCSTLSPDLPNSASGEPGAGLYFMTPDGSPIIGRADQPDDYWMAIGMCGQGFMFGPGVGSLLARIITQKSCPYRIAKSCVSCAPTVTLSAVNC